MKPRMKKIIIMAMLTICIATTAQERQFAVTEFSVNYLRIMPDYESALETQELMGTVVEIIGEKGYWRQIITPQPYKAWCTDKGLAMMSETEIREYITTPKYICTAPWGRVYTRKSEDSQPLCDIVCGDIMRKVLKSNGRPAVYGRWAEVMLPSGKTGFVSKKHIKDFREWAASCEANADNILRTAKMFTGVPYLWGGMSSKGLDCSGLPRLTWFLNGVLLPRNASQQVHTGDDVPVNPDTSFEAGSEGLREEMQRRVRNLMPGDLVFFGTPAAKNGHGADAAKDRITHVGIYIGDNHIIHSSHTVRINSLIPGDEDYYENAHRLIRARRIIGQEDKGKGIISISNSPAYLGTVL